MKTELFLVPAYGRKYDTSEQAIADWEEGKDFKIYRGPYTSIRDFDKLSAEYDVIYIMLKNEVTTIITLKNEKSKNLIDSLI